MPDDRKQLVPYGREESTLPVLSRPALPVAPLTEEEEQVELEELKRATLDLKDFALSENTKHAYQKAWSRFETWCFRRRRSALPATTETVHLFAVAALEKGIERANGEPAKGPVSIPTLDVFFSAIIAAHALGRHPNPVEGITPLDRQAMQNKHGRPPKKKVGLSIDDLSRLVDSVRPKNTTVAAKRRALRDKAILLVAFWSGGRRRSEIAGMLVEDIRRRADGRGWDWTLRKSKTDQKGTGKLLLIPVNPRSDVCPATALETWLSEANIRSGPVFRGVTATGRLGVEPLTPSLVAQLVKKQVKKAGLDPDNYAGHSLRRGFITSMERLGVDSNKTMQRSGHVSYDTYRMYVEEAQLGADDDPIVKALREKG